MRRLARELGIEAMSLYHHVANKEAVVDGMIDIVFGQIELPAAGLHWRAAMRRRGDSVRAVLGRHPWAAGLMESRTSPGPANLRHHEAVLACLRAAGFSLEMTGHAYSLLDSYIYGFAQQETSLPLGSAEQLRASADSIMAAIPPGEYPHLVEYATERVMRPGFDYSEEFAFGLELILDGLERALARPAGRHAALPGRLPDQVGNDLG